MYQPRQVKVALRQRKTRLGIEDCTAIQEFTADIGIGLYLCPMHYLLAANLQIAGYQCICGPCHPCLLKQACANPSSISRAIH